LVTLKKIVLLIILAFNGIFRLVELIRQELPLPVGVPKFDFISINQA